MPERPNDIQDSLGFLKSHPFTYIGLSDREKFHTGMLRHALCVLLKLDVRKFWDLMAKIWVDSAGVQTSSDVQILVEHNSIDLLIKIGGSAACFAEVKVKTTLGNHQIEKYCKKMPSATGVVLGLFPEVKDLPQGVEWKSFAAVIPDYFSEYCTEIFGQIPANDDVTLLIMYLKYLKKLEHLVTWFSGLSMGAVPGVSTFYRDLVTLKLKGIFERYRYDLVSNEVTDLGLLDTVTLKSFNSHGNSAIEYSFGGKFRCGLQWQGRSLKLFADDPNYKNGNSNARDAYLHQLHEYYTEKFGKKGRSKLNRIGKFRSITIEKWDILDDLRARPNDLHCRIQHLHSFVNC